MIAAIAWYYLREQLQLCPFLIFFYEVGVGLWDFLLSAGLGVLFHSENFINTGTIEYLVGIWLVRVLMLGVSVILTKKYQKTGGTMRLFSIIVILGLFGTLILSQQKNLAIRRRSDWFMAHSIFGIIVCCYVLPHEAAA